MPRAQTFLNIFQVIDPDQFSECLVEHLQTLWHALASQIIAVDGKALRGSHELNKSADHAVSAWAADTGVTLDAMGTHTHIAQLIVDKEADYLLALKGNQGNSHKEVMDHFEIALRHLDLKKAKGWTISQDHEKGHGRVTTRTVLATKNLSALDPEIKERWPELKSLIVVETDTTIVATGKARKKERRYYLSSLEATAERFQKAIRQHWSIENTCHWVLDTCFREDHNQTCKANAAKNLGTMRRIVLNILKEDKGVKGSLPTKRLRALMNHIYRERLLSLGKR